MENNIPKYDFDLSENAAVNHSEEEIDNGGIPVNPTEDKNWETISELIELVKFAMRYMKPVNRKEVEQKLKKFL